MKKWLVWFGVAGLLCFGASRSDSQTEEFQTIVVTGTADVLMDSTLTAGLMKDKRLYINGIYWWYDNGANTNQIFVEVVRGTSALREAGVRRQFKYSEAMTSSGIKGTSMPMNVTTGPDSAIYFVISGASSDSLYMAVNYKIIGE